MEKPLAERGKVIAIDIVNDGTSGRPVRVSAVGPDQNVLLVDELDARSAQQGHVDNPLRVAVMAGVVRSVGVPGETGWSFESVCDTLKSLCGRRTTIVVHITSPGGTQRYGSSVLFCLGIVHGRVMMEGIHKTCTKMNRNTNV